MDPSGIRVSNGGESLLGEINLVGPTPRAEINDGDRDLAVPTRRKNAFVSASGATHRVSMPTRRTVVEQPRIRSCYKRASVFESVA